MQQSTIIYSYNGKKEITKPAKHNHFRPWYTEENFLDELKAAFSTTQENLQQRREKSKFTFLRRIICKPFHDDTKEIESSVKSNDDQFDNPDDTLIDLSRRDDGAVLVGIRNPGGDSTALDGLFRKSIASFYNSSAFVKPGSIHALIASVPPIY